MAWTALTFAGLALTLLFLALVWQVLHLAIVLQWSDHQTRGARYYARSPVWRTCFKRLLRVHAVLLSPILTLLGALARPKFSQRCIRYAGASGPAGACTAESFRQAAEYAPRSEDVFVVTQMRSGTTWMQHLVYQVLTRGGGDLVAGGTALNAVSPWIESVRTIGVADAPLVGRERPSRIIKTHLPLALCPQDRRAKYIYVARHPLTCFASCVDFVRGNLQGFAPDWPEFARWFQSDELMWWGTWVRHVGHWQRHAETETNVLARPLRRHAGGPGGGRGSRRRVPGSRAAFVRRTCTDYRKMQPRLYAASRRRLRDAPTASASIGQPLLQRGWQRPRPHRPARHR